MTAIETIKHNHKAQTFVKVVAWIFIILSGIGLLSTFVQNIVMWTLPVYDDITMTAKDVKGLPLVTKMIMTHLRFYLLGSLVFLSAVLVSSVGLLKLKEWAKTLFSFLLAVSALFSVIMMPSTVSAFGKDGMFALPSDAEFKPLIMTVMIISFLFSIVLIAAAVWIIVKLNSVKIKSLFETTASNAQG